jgi:hypothetical protein
MSPQGIRSYARDVPIGSSVVVDKLSSSVDERSDIWIESGSAVGSDLIAVERGLAVSAATSESSPCPTDGTYPSLTRYSS